jgi:Rrf2 family protein
MLSATADHALRAVLFLARQPGDQVVSAECIAQAIRAPRNYLSKILDTLRKHGLVRSASGRRGGFALARDPARVSIADVVAPFQPMPVAAQCLLGAGACDPTAPCAAHFRWSAISRAYQSSLNDTALAELLAGGRLPHSLRAANLPPFRITP